MSHCYSRLSATVSNLPLLLNPSWCRCILYAVTTNAFYTTVYVYQIVHVLYTLYKCLLLSYNEYLLLQAATNNLTSPRYVWIVYGWYSSDWWVSSQASQCSDNDIREFLDISRVLVIQPYQAQDDSEITGGIVSQLSYCYFTLIILYVFFVILITF